MTNQTIIDQIDAEIARLQQVRTLLLGTTIPAKRGRGENQLFALSSPSRSVKKKRNLTPEGRARIAAAVKKRWAKQKAAKAKK